MEEIITLDGRQFKLTVDRPLNATERAQVLTEIRKQTGCGTCGSQAPRTLSAGEVYSLPFDTVITGTGTSGKQSGQSVTLSASPGGGVRPYTVRFWYSRTGTAPLTQVGATGTQTTNPASPENTAVTDSYTLSDADIAGAVGNTTALPPSAVSDTDGTITLGGTAVGLATGSIRFYSSVVDSCPSTDKGKCAQFADVATACIAPTCNFVVT